MMDEKGVFGVARSVWDCDAFMKQRFTQREAWLWLVGAAVWRDSRVNVDGQWYDLERGEFCYSSRFLSKKWGWSKDAVLRFMKHLKSEAMLCATKRASNPDAIPVYLINKYNEFQVVGLPKASEPAPESAPLIAPATRQPCAKEEALQTLEEKKVSSSKPPKGDFDGFWESCPRKVGKGAARKAYLKAVLKTAPETLVAGMRRYAATRAGEPEQFTAHPATWLAAERWLDQTGPPSGGATIHVLSPEIRRQEQENLRKMGLA